MPDTEVKLESAFTDAATSAQPEPQTPPTAQVPETTPSQSDQSAATSPAPASPPTTGPQPAVSPGLLERAKAAGLDGEFNDYESMMTAVLDRYISERPYVEYGRSQLASGQQSAQQQAHGEAAPDTEEGDENAFDLDKHFSSVWSVPKLSDNAAWAMKHGVFTEDENGRIVAAPGMEQYALPHLTEVNHFATAQRELNEKFRENPVKFIYEGMMPALEHKFGQYFQQLNQQTVQTYEQQNFVKQFETDNASWLYEGNKLSERGMQFKQIVGELRQDGINDPQRLATLAMKILGPAPTAQPNTPPATEGEQAGTTPAPAAPNTDRPRNPDGTFAKPTKQESFLDSARKKATASESHGGGAPASAIVANEGDLENMFVTARKRQLAAA